VGDQLSAVVLMRPAGGGTVGEAARAATAEQLLPDPDAFAAAQALFREAGFEVVGPVGPSFSIIGSKELFERTFGTRLVGTGTGTGPGGVTTDEGAVELPLDPLPSDLARSVQAITFTPPPAFGPTEFR
jgi:hypothetical protein